MRETPITFAPGQDLLRVADLGERMREHPQQQLERLPVPNRPTLTSTAGSSPRACRALWRESPTCRRFESSGDFDTWRGSAPPSPGSSA
jgi:hypothetical protein